MNNKEFIWTDALAREFAELYLYANDISDRRSLTQQLEDFKSSHTPKPLFTTYDGVDVYEGNTVYTLGVGYPFGHLVTRDSNLQKFMTFSTPEAAKAYSYLHKKQFSIVDIQKAARNVAEIRQNQGLIQRLTDQK